MDPISHVILARTIVAALETPDGSRFGRGAASAAMLGALSPDADCVLMPAGWDIYLRFLEIATHSLAGSLVLGCITATLIRPLARGSRTLKLAVAASLGAVSHLALDVMSGARLGVGWPISNTRVTWPLVAMAEPWLIALLIAGATAQWLGRGQLRRTALIVVIVVTAFFGIKGTLYARARRVADMAGRHSAGSPRAFEARWGSWTKWNVFEKDANALRTWQVDGWTGTRELLLSWPLRPDPALVDASRSLNTVRNFVSVHDLTFAVERRAEDGRREVLWSDVRYCWQTVPGTEKINCGLWFGGTFDAEGRALRQVVLVGGWTQTRPVSW
jgi:membrane-bound metal-dependent hydrolase YbcI (DUF457 family)